ncbi:solute carrier family 26 member 6-like protein [Leptotrombidium deliense]|uniref:Solute carrier family 26 member 6-like protein n=1 Tax=Leptotrombidium deliense TaxID=299467 RepID=A0A443S747_9ACAR|nr:solute carrier family 26 member 6-like protein [Leptotrombidium deliense]
MRVTCVHNKMQCRNNLNLDMSNKYNEDATVEISRIAYNLTAFEKAFDVIQPQKDGFCDKFVERVKQSCDVQRWKNGIRNILPIIDWLPQYNVKQNLLSDIITGITVAVFQVPQSMGYCLIAHLPPVHGLYTAFFPSMFFSLFATSRHTAVGACAILSGVMTGNLVSQVMQTNGVSLHQLEAMNINSKQSYSTVASTNTETIGANLQPFEVATAAAFWIGVYMLLFGVLRLGFISIYLSEQLISGFTVAATFYGFTSQLRYLFGVHLPYNSGMFSIIRSYLDLIREYRSINPVTTSISLICCAILLFFKIYINELLRKKGIKIPFPIELLVVIGGTIVSNLMDLNGNYNVQIVGEIKRGLPLPEIPRLEMLKQTWLQSISLAIVGYTLNLSIGKLYGNKHAYEVKANQELIALGTANTIASFFRCLPSTASLPRSAVQEQAGGKTQAILKQ